MNMGYLSYWDGDIYTWEGPWGNDVCLTTLDFTFSKMFLAIFFSICHKSFIREGVLVRLFPCEIIIFSHTLWGCPRSHIKENSGILHFELSR